MNKKISVTVNEGLCNYLYLLSLNIESRKSLLDTFVEKLGLKDPTIKAYMDEYYIYDAKYKMAQNSITATITAFDPAIIDWSMEFATATMTLTVPENYEVSQEFVKLCREGFATAVDDSTANELMDLYSNDKFTDEHGLIDTDDCGCKSCGCTNKDVDVLHIETVGATTVDNKEN